MTDRTIQIELSEYNNLLNISKSTDEYIRDLLEQIDKLESKLNDWVEEREPTEDEDE